MCINTVSLPYVSQYGDIIYQHILMRALAYTCMHVCAYNTDRCTHVYTHIQSYITSTLLTVSNIFEATVTTTWKHYRQSTAILGRKKVYRLAEYLLYIYSVWIIMELWFVCVPVYACMYRLKVFMIITWTS